MSQQAVNKVIVLGNVERDAEPQFTSGGRPVANFSVAVNESFKNSNGDSVDRAQWFRCVAWNGLVELCGQYLTRGRQVYLEGRVQTCKYDDKAGNARTVTEVVVSTLRLLGGPRNGSAQASAENVGVPPAAGNGASEGSEDIAF
jgi:single-strand DNA-binding protein